MRAASASASGPSSASVASRRGIFQRHIVGDDVFVQVLVERFARFGLGIEEEMVRAAENIHVGQNAALRRSGKMRSSLRRAGAARLGWWSWRAAGARDLRRYSDDLAAAGRSSHAARGAQQLR